MDPLTGLDRELAKAMQVEPAADFAARVRTRIAADATQISWQMPRWVIPAIAGAVVLAVAANLVPSNVDRADVPQLSHRQLIVMSPLPAAVPPTPPVFQSEAPRLTASPQVMVSRSEMLALQRLLSGAVVMPASEASSDELSIPAITIDAIPDPSGSPGERQ